MTLTPWTQGMNPEQTRAIEHGLGPCVLKAAAGSGKTRVLVHRIARLVAEGVPQHRILAVTFSKRAANEMNTRLKNLGVTEARVSTWHALCLQILREDGTDWGSWQIDDKNAAQYVLKTALGFKHMNWKDADIGEVERFIGLCKANLHRSTGAPAMELAERMFDYDAERAVQAYAKYQELLAERRLLTFDDFLVYAWVHLQDEEVRARWAARWDQVLQDECQDASPSQIAIAELLVRDHKNYMVVGDCFQSIYGFRGSNPEYLAEFGETWDASRIDMNRNYRSASQIVLVANDIIRSSPKYLTSEMVGERTLPGAVSVERRLNFDDEGYGMSERWLPSMLTHSKLSECVVLYRKNAQSRALEESLLRNKVPYAIVGGFGFYERKEVRDLLAYLRVAAGDSTLDSIKRCINAPFRFLGNAFVERLLQAWEADSDPVKLVESVAQQAGLQHRQVESARAWGQLVEGIRQDILAGEAPTRVLNSLIEKTKYLEWVRGDQGEESADNSHVQNVCELVQTSSRFRTVAELLDFVEQTMRASAMQKERKVSEKLLLMTIHKSKSLEWKNVFVAGCNENIIPHVRGDLEEERRLMYVAVTRARDNLTLSYVCQVARGGGVAAASPSRFIAHLVKNGDEN